MRLNQMKNKPKTTITFRQEGRFKRKMIIDRDIDYLFYAFEQYCKREGWKNEYN